MTHQNRVDLVQLIWGMLGMLSIAAVITDRLGLWMFIPLAIAILATFVFGVLPGMLDAVQEQREKAKRSPQDRVALLLELMDEDERAAFKAELKQRILDDAHRAQDGELPLDDTSLAALLNGNGVARDKRHG